MAVDSDPTLVLQMRPLPCLQVSLDTKLFWTFAALAIYLVCSHIPLYGIPQATGGCVAPMRPIADATAAPRLVPHRAPLPSPRLYLVSSPAATPST